MDFVVASGAPLDVNGHIELNGGNITHRFPEPVNSEWSRIDNGVERSAGAMGIGRRVADSSGLFRRAPPVDRFPRPPLWRHGMRPVDPPTPAPWPVRAPRGRCGTHFRSSHTSRGVCDDRERVSRPAPRATRPASRPGARDGSARRGRTGCATLNRRRARCDASPPVHSRAPVARPWWPPRLPARALGGSARRSRTGCARLNRRKARCDASVPVQRACAGGCPRWPLPPEHGRPTARPRRGRTGCAPLNRRRARCDASVPVRRARAPSDGRGATPARAAPPSTRAR